jgi:hypothetical protein
MPLLANILVSLHPHSSLFTALGMTSADDQMWKKSKKFAPVLCQDSLCFLTSMAIASRCPLRQGDCKNAFVKAFSLPTRLPLFALLAETQRPLLTSIGFSGGLCTAFGAAPIIGTIKSALSFDRLDSRLLSSIHVSIMALSVTLPTLWPVSLQRLYPLGCTLTTLSISWKIPQSKPSSVVFLLKCCKVDFMGIVEWFLGVHVLWRVTSSSVAVHLNQSGFAINLVKSFARQARHGAPTATPYRSGIPIDSIAPSLDADDSPAQC